MHFEISWLNEEQRVLLISSAGRWDELDAAAQWNEVIVYAPNYIIWDVTNMIILSGLYELPEKGSEREVAIAKLANFLRQAEFIKFYAVETTKHPVFDTLHEIARNYQLDGKIQLVPSIEAALEIIQGN